MRRRVRVLVLLPLVIVGGCDSGKVPIRQAPVSSLSASEHEEVMGLLKQIYQSGLGDHIVAWYETTARGYYDVFAQKNVEFDAPIQTLSVAIPEYFGATKEIQSRMEELAKNTTYNGWRLVQYRVELEPQGAGGGPSGSYDKFTIYPIIVEGPVGTVPQSGQRAKSDRPETGELVNATRNGDIAAMKKLLAAGADPNAQVNGDTPLVIAATHGRKEPLMLLLEYGAQVDGRDNIGTTPLLAATLNGNEEAVAALIAKGAQVDAKMPNGVTAIEVAELKGYTNIVKMLRNAKAK